MDFIAVSSKNFTQIDKNNVKTDLASNTKDSEFKDMMLSLLSQLSHDESEQDNVLNIQEDIFHKHSTTDINFDSEEEVLENRLDSADIMCLLSCLFNQNPKSNEHQDNSLNISNGSLNQSNLDQIDRVNSEQDLKAQNLNNTVIDNNTQTDINKAFTITRDSDNVMAAYNLTNTKENIEIYPSYDTQNQLNTTTDASSKSNLDNPAEIKLDNTKSLNFIHDVEVKHDIEIDYEQSLISRAVEGIKVNAERSNIIESELPIEHKHIDEYNVPRTEENMVQANKVSDFKPLYTEGSTNGNFVQSRVEINQNNFNNVGKSKAIENLNQRINSTFKMNFNQKANVFSLYKKEIGAEGIASNLNNEEVGDIYKDEALHNNLPNIEEVESIDFHMDTKYHQIDEVGNKYNTDDSEMASELLTYQFESVESSGTDFTNIESVKSEINEDIYVKKNPEPVVSRINKNTEIYTDATNKDEENTQLQFDIVEASGVNANENKDLSKNIDDNSDSNLFVADVSIRDAKFEVEIQDNETFEVKSYTDNIVEEMSRRIIESADYVANDGSHKISISLKPEFLGRLDITVVSENNRITARIKASNEDVLEALETKSTVIIEYLKTEGVDINDIELINYQPDESQMMNDFTYLTDQGRRENLYNQQNELVYQDLNNFNTSTDSEEDIINEVQSLKYGKVNFLV